MTTRSLKATITLLAVLVTTTADVTSQQPATTDWRHLLEQAAFARAYEGQPEKADELFDRALAAARRSGDATAEQEVQRQRQNASDPQDPRTVQVIARLLQTIAATDVANREQQIGGIEWDYYLLDDSAVQLVAGCLDGPVVLAGQTINLRPEDVFSISYRVDDAKQALIWARAFASADAFVRSYAARECDRQQYLAQLTAAIIDSNQLVRETACEVMQDVEDPRLDDLFLRAVDMKTAAAIERAVNSPGFATRMRAAGSNSWLAGALLQRQPGLYVEAWDDGRRAMVATLLDWAEATGPSQQATRWLELAKYWLHGDKDAKGYPAELAKRTIRLALQNGDHFDANVGVRDRTTLGVIVQALGSIDDLETLVPLWVHDARRGPEDCDRLSHMCQDIDASYSDRLIAIGVTAAKQLPVSEPERQHAIACCFAYWNNLGGHSWWRAEPAALDRAFAAIDRLDPSFRDRAYAGFVLGVKNSQRNAVLFARMEPHYVRLVVDGLVAAAARVDLTSLLVDRGSQFGADAAFALAKRGELGKRQNREVEPDGDFLRRACSTAPERGLDAALAAIRSGYTTPPPASNGQQMTQTEWPMGGAHEPGGIIGFISGPPPVDKIVLKQEQRMTTLPSLLCVLPVDQAARGAATLWNETDCPLPREQLIATLLAARTSKVALATLVQRFDELSDVQTQARVLAVFGEMLHTPARALIARALDSTEPLLRYSALRAAESLLAYERARAAMAGDGTNAPRDK